LEHLLLTHYNSRLLALVTNIGLAQNLLVTNTPTHFSVAPLTNKKVSWH